MIGEGRQRCGYGEREEVEDRAQPRHLSDDRKAGFRPEELEHTFGQRDLHDEEAPEGECVGQSGPGPLEQFLLSDDLDQLVPQTLWDVAHTLWVWCPRHHELGQLEDPFSSEGTDDNDEDQKTDRAPPRHSVRSSWGSRRRKRNARDRRDACR